MHIADGILTWYWCLIWFIVAGAFVFAGARQLAARRKLNPSYMSLVGLMGAAVFVISVWHIPVPVTGSCSHPVGTPMAAMIIGPGRNNRSIRNRIVLPNIHRTRRNNRTWRKRILNGNRWDTHRIWSILSIKKSRRLNLAFSRHRRSSWRLNDIHNRSL